MCYYLNHQLIMYLKKTIEWVASYLNNRQHCTRVKGQTSRFSEFSIGVPQVLGPLYSSVYINDLPSICCTIAVVVLICIRFLCITPLLFILDLIDLSDWGTDTVSMWFWVGNCSNTTHQDCSLPKPSAFFQNIPACLCPASAEAAVFSPLPTQPSGESGGL